MKKLKIILTAVLFLSVSQNVFARRAPTQPNTYDGIAPSARSMAMGGAGAGLINSKESFYYNSANLAYMKGTHVEAGVVVSKQSNMSPSRVAEIDPSAQGLNSAFTMKDNGALIWQALANNSIKVTNPDGSWEETETYINSITFAAGQESDKGFSMGLNMTYLYGKIGESAVDSFNNPLSNVGSGNGFTFDLSFAFPMGNNLFLGLNLKNIAGFMFWNDYNTEQLPFTVRAGLGYTLRGFAMALDWDRKFYRFGDLEEDHFYMGIEQYLNGFICVRGGLTSDKDFKSDEMKYSYGLGLKLKSYELAFAGEQYKIEDDKFSRFMISFTASVM